MEVPGEGAEDRGERVHEQRQDQGQGQQDGVTVGEKLKGELEETGAGEAGAAMMASGSLVTI